MELEKNFVKHIAILIHAIHSAKRDLREEVEKKGMKENFGNIEYDTIFRISKYWDWSHQQRKVLDSLLDDFKDWIQNYEPQF